MGRRAWISFWRSACAAGQAAQQVGGSRDLRLDCDQVWNREGHGGCWMGKVPTYGLWRAACIQGVPPRAGLVLLVRGSLWGVGGLR